MDLRVKIHGSIFRDDRSEEKRDENRVKNSPRSSDKSNRRNSCTFAFPYPEIIAQEEIKFVVKKKEQEAPLT